MSTLTKEVQTEIDAHRGGQPLRVGVLLGTMPPAFRREAEAVLRSPYSSAAVSAVLKRHGYKVSESAIRRWRKDQP